MEEGLKRIKEESRAQNLIKTAKLWASLLAEYLKEKRVEVDLKPCSVDKLANVLEKLYVDVRRKQKMAYFIEGHCFVDCTLKFIVTFESQHFPGWISVSSEEMQLLTRKFFQPILLCCYRSLHKLVKRGVSSFHYMKFDFLNLANTRLIQDQPS